MGGDALGEAGVWGPIVRLRLRLRAPESDNDKPKYFMYDCELNYYYIIIIAKKC